MSYNFADSRYEVLVSSEVALGELGFEPSFFNSLDFLEFYSSKNRYIFYLQNTRTKVIKGLYHVWLDRNEARSPYKAPYGSFEFASEIDITLIESFIQFVLFFLHKKQIKSIKIIHYPFCYNLETSAIITNALLQFGFQIEFSQLNHHVEISDDNFRAKLHDSEKRRLEKCLKNNFTFQKEDASFLPEAYSLIEFCRNEKKKPLSLSKSQLEEFFLTFPDRYLIFSVRKQQKIIAVTIAVKVSSNILLTAYPASPTLYNTYSPTVMLNEGLYKFCQENNYKILDLGISGTREDPHYSLLKFKEHLGSKESLKLIFSMCK